MYRQVQQVLDKMSVLQRELRAGIVASSTQEMSTRGSMSMALIDEMIETLRRGAQVHDTGEPEVNADLVGAAQRALDLAWARIEKLALGTDTTLMREALLDSKTYVDLTAAYVAASLGTEFEV
jgi:hypothetical protein